MRRMAEPSIVAARMQEIREAKKWSRQQLADRLDVTYLQVYRMETGEVDISASDVPGIAEALGCSVASLYREARAS